MQSTGNLLARNNGSAQAELPAARDFLGVTKKLQNEPKAASTPSGLLLAVRELLSLKLEKSISLYLAKTGAYQDGVQLLDKKTFFEKLSSKSDSRLKKLTTSTS